MFSSPRKILQLARPILVAAMVFTVAACGGTPEERAQAHYTRGMEFLTQQDYVKAGIEFKNALQLQKNMVGAWRGIARVEEHNKNWPGVAAALRTIVELNNDDVESRVRLARLLAVGNALDDALNHLNKAGEIDPRHVGVYVTRAAILFRLNEVSGAVREARAALEIAPDNAEALMVLASERLLRRDAEGALKLLEKVSPAQSTDVGVELFRVRVFEQLGDVKQVEAVLRRLIELNPEHDLFRRLLVTYFLTQERRDDAEKELRAFVAAKPKDREAFRLLVQFLLKVKGPKVARQELVNRISAGGDQTVQHQLALADFDSALGNEAEAIELLEKLAKDPGGQSLAARVKLAEMHVSRKRIEKAEALVAEVLRQDKGNVDGLRLRAIIRTEQGQFDAAIADARAALNDQPRSTQLMLVLAVAYERSGSIELAERQLAEATKVSEFNPAVGLNYASFLRRRGNLARSEDILTELAARRPDNTQVLSALAETRLSQQDWVGAEEVAASMRRLNSVQADHVLGLALSGRSQFEESIQVLQRAFAAAPSDARPMSAIVNTYIRAKQYDRAVAFLNGILKTNSSNAEALVLQGTVQLLTNAPRDAVQSFQLAIERQPTNIVGYRALARHLFRNKDVDGALKIAKSGLSQVPNDMPLRMQLAEILETKGDLDGAIAEYEGLLKQNSGALVVANNLASLLSEHRRDKESLDRAFSLAVNLRSAQTPHFKDTLGWIYYLRGDYKNALPLLVEAAVALPNNPLVRYHLGMAYIASEQVAKGSEELKRARDLEPIGDVGSKIQVALEKIGM